MSDPVTCWRDPEAKSIGFFAKGPNSRVDEALLLEIKAMALKTGENTRISLHPNTDASFHEMVIFQHREKIYLPKKHKNKDKSFHFIEGKIALFIFDDDGHVTDSCILDGHQNRIFRVAKNVYHVDIPLAPHAIHHEITLGPFTRNSDDSQIAPWALAKNNKGAYSTYLGKLLDTLEDTANPSYDVLLTGALGYCGSHILDHLAAHGHSIAAVIRPDGHIEYQNDPSTDETRNVTYVRTDLEALTGLPRNVKTIVHVAAKRLGPNITSQDFATSNVEVTRRLINYALQSGAEKFIFLSSISVYGEIRVSEINDATPINNPNPYGVSKLLCEQMLADCADELPSISLRLPGVIGPRSEHNWLSRVLELLKAGQPVYFNNPQTPFNNAVHLNELAGFINQLIKHPLGGAETINLASNGYLTVGEVVALLRCQSSSSSELFGVDAPELPNFTINIESWYYSFPIIYSF